MPEKRCTKCGGEGPFGKHSQTKDGLQSWCKGCVKANTKKWENENRERVRQKNRDWYKRNPEQGLTNTRTWQAANPDRVRTIVADWKKTHPEPGRRYSQRRRARVAATENTLTDTEWQETLEYFNHACAYCGRGDRPLTQEHIIPVSEGGGYTKENIVPACKPCNSKKRNKSIFAMLSVDYCPHQPR